MVRKNRTPEETQRRAKIRELLQVSNVSRYWGEKKSRKSFSDFLLGGATVRVAVIYFISV
ncbi:MAG: hypothetical protein SPF51_10270 [Candidatus Fimivicinus sp.]|nr:hypothetical protein [Oscillospiraceae bacterium]MDY5591903.1 hypothetical protein [Candidatus Fimivicinus sp.]